MLRALLLGAALSSISLLSPAPLQASTATATTLELAADGIPVSTVKAHTAITLTAVVKAGSAALTAGQVSFCDAAAAYCEDVHVLGTAQITAAGKAVLRFVPSAGSHSYKAVFLGTHAASSSVSTALPLTVIRTNDYSTATSLTSSGTLGAYTLTASVTGKGSVAPPTGKVYFLDRSNSNTELGKVQLPSGIPKVNYLTTPVGSFAHDNAGSYVAVADFNNDGKPDLATFTGKLPNVLLSNGDGSFQEVSTPQTSTVSLHSISTGDFNGDGNADLVVVSQPFQEYTQLFLGDGTGHFGDAINIEGAFNCCSVEAVGDFDHDGNADLLLYRSGSQTIEVLRGRGDGTFQGGWKSATLTTSFYGIGNGIVTGDFNGDGDLDFAWTYITVGQPGVPSTIRRAAVYLNQGDGTYRGTDYPLAITAQYVLLTVADFNGDGRQDILAIDQSTPANTAAVMFGNPDGTFTQKVVDGFGMFSENSLVGDFNGDGIADVSVYLYSPSEQRVLLGNGDGSFTTAGATKVPSDVYFFAGTAGSADFDGDGVTDVAGLYRGKYVALLTKQTQTASVSVSAKAPSGAGAHEVVARYRGDEDFSTSVSAPVSLAASSSTPVATLSTTLLQFSNEQPLTMPSGAKTVTLTNTGTAPLTISSLAVVPGNGVGASFASSNTCPASLAAGATCSIRVRFVPFSDGAKISKLVITDNAGNSPQTVTLSGKSEGTPQLSLSTSALVFAERAAYTRSDPQSVTVTNTGNADLHFSSIALSHGSGASDFRTSNNCYETLRAGKTCTIRVRFTPYNKEPLAVNAGYVILTDDAPGAVQYVAVEGISTFD